MRSRKEDAKKNIFMELKGKTVFTQNEIDKLRSLIRQRCNADRKTQKEIRKEMRKIGFYGKKCFDIQDMTVEKFDKLLIDKRITIVNESSSKTGNAKKDTHVETSSENHCVCFEPLIDSESEILVLGTMPGNDSLKAQKYYADPRNCFWKIIKDLFNSEKEFGDYGEKKACLLKNHIALWDVLAECDREGSSDKEIKNEKYNDISELLRQYPKIKRIVFNGKKDKKNFRCQVECETVRVISTSSATIGITYEKKLDEWGKVLRFEEKAK